MSTSTKHWPRFVAAAGLIISICTVRGEAPPAEQILPNDTLAMMTVPDWKGLCDQQSGSPQLRLWNDPVMKPFRDHFLENWKQEVVEPLERELGLQFEEYKGLIQGQFTLALIKNSWEAGSDEQPGSVILIDSKEHQDQLATNLTELRQKWVEKGKSIRTENVRGVEFTIVELSTNDIPNTLRKFMPGSSDVQELTGEEATEPKKRELFIGQSGSLLIMVDALTTAQKVMNRLTGGSLPPLAEIQQFSMDQGRLFRTAGAYGWVNTAVLLDVFEKDLARKAADRQENAPDPLAQIQPAKVISATGLSGLRSAAFAYTQAPMGSEFTLFLGVPESERKGIFRIMAGEPKETMPPSFVPADVVEYQRWRLDGQKTYTALEQMLQEISPQMLNGWNFALNTADLAAKEKDPNFDLRQQLMGNLGDDMITYKKGPKSTSLEDLQSQPSLFLLGTKNGEQLVSSLKMVLGMFMRGTPPTSRDFLGTTIHTFELPNPAMQMDPEASPTKLNMAVSRGYVAITSDDPMLEEFLRSADSPPRPLRQLAGLAESTEAVVTPGTSLLSFEDQKAVMRTQLELLRRAATNESTDLQDPMTPIPESLGVGLPRKGLTEWFDFSLIPPFERIEKYFYHTVYAGGGSVEGLTLKVFSPTPPQLRGQQETPEPPTETPAETDSGE